MSIRGDIKALLEADGTLAAIVTGGIYDWDEDTIGRRGLTPTNTPDAYDGALLLPCLVVKAREAQPFGGVADDAEQYVTFSQIVELWFYQDSGYDQIELAMARAAALLQGQRVSGTFIIRWAGNPVLDQQAMELQGASVSRADYQVVAALSPS